MSTWRERLAAKAAERTAKNLVRCLRTPDPELKDFCSNDYLGLSREPEVMEAARDAISRYGTGARASRLVVGNLALHEELEQQLASFKGTEAALVYPSGYQANLGLLSLLLEAEDAVFVDRLAHSCLVDGVRLSPAKLRVFPHGDLKRLEELLAAVGDAPARWIIVDAVYSMDGDIAPLPGLLELAARYDATIIMDDAHGTGVLGATGRGTAEHFGIDPRRHQDRLIITATLSKALGSQGGVVLGSAELRDALINASRPFVYTTGLNPASAAAALAGIRLIQREPERVSFLQRRSVEALAFFRSRGIDTLRSETPIIPLILGEAAAALEASARLREKGLLLLPIRPPTVPKGTSRLRMTVTAPAAGEAFMDSCETIARALQSRP